MTADSAPAVPRPPARQSPAPEITGAEAVVRSLELLGVTDVFGLPGGAILPGLRPADGRFRAPPHPGAARAGRRSRGRRATRRQSGKVGVCIATSGPGATNLVTAIADAYMDSVPMLAITGQVFSTLMGTDAFQEADIVGITMPITKHSFLVKMRPRSPGAIAARTRSPVPVVPVLCWSTSRRTRSRRPPRSCGRPKIDLPATAR